MRPLRCEQMKYAAMDGYCLLNLYEKLKDRAERLLSYSSLSKLYFLNSIISHSRLANQRKTGDILI